MVLDLTEPLDVRLRAHLHIRILALLHHLGLLPQLRGQVQSLDADDAVNDYESGDVSRDAPPVPHPDETEA